MIGLDTNILIRHLTRDDRVQSPVASRFLEQDLTEEAPGFVSLVTMVETVWVLERSYSQNGRELVASIDAILQNSSLVIEDEQLVYAARVAVAEGLGTFGDAVIGLLSQRAGCSRIVTFDTKAIRLPSFELLR